MRYFSTFSGIGGFEIGIERAALSVRHGATENTEPETSESGMEPATTSLFPDRHISDTELRGNTGPVSCVGYSEIDKYATSVYEYHYPGVKNYGDITKINEEELPDFDCLVGGFPCQAFSIAGKRRGFEDTRGTLFFDLARILRAKQPRYFVFENVKGLLSHDQGNTFRTIIATTDELGYDVQWQVLNSKNHGVPQNRERIYIVGHLRGTPRPEVFPITGNNNEDTQSDQGRNTELFPTIRATHYKNGDNQPVIKVVGQLDDETWSKRNDSIRRVYATEGLAPTIPTGTGGGVMPKITDDVRIRRLTPKECERLQGFPDDWTSISTNGTVSDTQRYKMCGNAVTTNVVQAVFERLLCQF